MSWCVGRKLGGKEFVYEGCSGSGDDNACMTKGPGCFSISGSDDKRCCCEANLGNLCDFRESAEAESGAAGLLFGKLGLWVVVFMVGLGFSYL